MAVHFRPVGAMIVCHTEEQNPQTTTKPHKVTCEECLAEIEAVDEARRSSICEGCGGPKSPGLVMCRRCWDTGDYPYRTWKGRYTEWVRTVFPVNRRGV